MTGGNSSARGSVGKRLVVFVVAVASLAACGGSTSGTSKAAAANSFRLSEFAINPPANQLRTGRIDLTADNVGSETHEVVIVAANNPSELPLKPDGSVDEDKIPAAAKVGEIADVPARSKRTKAIELKSGTYVAFCNLVDTMNSGMTGGTAGAVMHGDTGAPSGVGHVHFALGMSTTFHVG